MSDPLFPTRGRPNPVVLSKTGQPTVLLLTVCTQGRHRWLACPEVHSLLREVSLLATDWWVGRYVIMPDHLHCLIGLGHPTRSVERWVQYWKSCFRKRHAHSDWNWQSRAFHHRLRNPSEGEKKWRYVLENPVRAGLISRLEGWPYQGHVFPLRW